MDDNPVESIPISSMNILTYLQSLSRSIHSSIGQQKNYGPKCVIAIAGGGCTGSSTLLSSPGASATILASHVPYAREATDSYLYQYLGLPFLSLTSLPPPPPQKNKSSSSQLPTLSIEKFINTYLLRTGKYASSEAAIQLARASLQECKVLLLQANISALATTSVSTDSSVSSSPSSTSTTSTSNNYPVFNYLQYTKDNRSKAIGIGVASALASVPLRNGSHRIYVCVCTDTEGERVYALNLHKGLRDRWYEDTVAGGLLISALYDAVIEKNHACITKDTVVPSLSSTDTVVSSPLSIETMVNQILQFLPNPSNSPSSPDVSVNNNTPTTNDKNTTTTTILPNTTNPNEFLTEKLYRIHRLPISPIQQLLNSIDTQQKFQRSHVIPMMDRSTDTKPLVGGSSTDTRLLTSLKLPLPSSYQHLLTPASTVPEKETYSVADSFVTHILWVPDNTLITVPDNISPRLQPKTINNDKPLLHYMLNAPLPPNTIIFPGSFNPLHRGHIELTKVACKLMNQHRPLLSSNEPPWQVLYELSIANVDKPSIPYDEIIVRLQQFGQLPSSVFPSSSPTDIRNPDTSSSTAATASQGGKKNNLDYPYSNGILLSSTPRFIDKAKLFPSCTFLIGYDTAVRLIQNKYYNNSENIMIESLYELYLQGTRFLVAGRSDGSSFLTYDKDLRPLVPSLLQGLFISISENDFRMDISSTEIRAARGTTK